jgi:hypothetical protein
VLGIGGSIVWVIVALPGMLTMGVLLPGSYLAISDSRKVLLLLLFNAAATMPAYGALIAVFTAFLSYAYRDLVDDAPPSA